MATHPSPPQGVPVVVLLGPVGVGKSLLASALAGLQLQNPIFQVGDSARAVTLEATCHRARWFGRAAEEELVLLDPPGVGDGDMDASRLGGAHHQRLATCQCLRCGFECGAATDWKRAGEPAAPHGGMLWQTILEAMGHG